MRKKIWSVLNVMLGVLGVVFAASSGVMAAVTGTLDDGGVSSSGESNLGDGTTVDPIASGAPHDGIATETAGRSVAEDLENEEFYSKDIDKRITKIRPMATPVDQISRYATAQKANSFEVKYYSVGTRPISCTVSTAVTAQTSGTSVKLEVSDPNMFTLDDTIRVVGVEGITDYKGNAYSGSNIPDLVLCVCGRDTDGMPLVYAVNGNLDSDGQAIWVPDIAADTTLVRMGKACAELDVQTGRFNNIPTAEVQYCQNFMIQVEQSTFDKIAAKEVDWNFSDLEEDSIYDMKLAQENTYLFGVKNKINHTLKNGMTTWFTGGIWYMAGKDIEVGTYDEDAGTAVITDDDLVDISKDLFVGTGIGNKRKVLFCGSDFLSALSKISSEKFRLKESVEVWNLKFKSWETDFGEILTIHHELFDQNAMSDCAFALDPEYLTKKTHVSWSRNILDLKKAGVRNTNAVVIQEVACLYLRYAKAHARLKLASA